MELQDTSQRITYYLDEGDYTHEGKKLSQLGEVEVGSFENQCSKYNFVELSSRRDGAMKKAETAAIGIISGAIEGNIPKESTQFEDLTSLRRAGITLLGPVKVFNAPLADDAGAISPNDPLIIDPDSGKLTTTDETDTGCVAEESKLANEGGFINIVVEGNKILVAEAETETPGGSG